MRFYELKTPGRYGLDDILDMNEILMVKAENESRAWKAAEKRGDSS